MQVSKKYCYCVYLRPPLDELLPELDEPLLRLEDEPEELLPDELLRLGLLTVPLERPDELLRLGVLTVPEDLVDERDSFTERERVLSCEDDSLTAGLAVLSLFCGLTYSLLDFGCLSLGALYDFGRSYLWSRLVGRSCPDGRS